MPPDISKTNWIKLLEVVTVDKMWGNFEKDMVFLVRGNALREQKRIGEKDMPGWMTYRHF